MKLFSEPALSSMVITRDGVWDNRMLSPDRENWPVGTTARIEVTDRSGADLATFNTTPVGNTIRFVVDPADLAELPDGANFEMFVTIHDDELDEDLTYKVRYGRVVRREVTFPANPVNSSVYNAALYTDSVGLRDTLGPFWVQKANKTVMHDNTIFSKPFGMGNDFFFFDKSATHWYAPLRSDSVKVQVSIMKVGGGQVVVALCSNYGMTDWIGVLFDCTANTVRPVTGSIGGPTEWTNQSTTVSQVVTDTPDTYTVWYDFPTNTIRLFHGSSLTPLFTWEDLTNVVAHGEGNRYTGLIYRGSLLSAGPQVSYWSAKDDL